MEFQRIRKAVACRNRRTHGRRKPRQGLPGIVAQCLQRSLERQAGSNQNGQLAQKNRHIARAWRSVAKHAASRQHTGRGGLDLAGHEVSRRGDGAIAEMRHRLYQRAYKFAVTRNTSSIVVSPARHLATPSSIIVIMPSLRATCSSSVASVLGPIAFRTSGETLSTSNTP